MPVFSKDFLVYSPVASMDTPKSLLLAQNNAPRPVSPTKSWPTFSASQPGYFEHLSYLVLNSAGDLFRLE